MQGELDCEFNIDLENKTFTIDLPKKPTTNTALSKTKTNPKCMLVGSVNVNLDTGEIWTELYIATDSPVVSAGQFHRAIGAMDVMSGVLLDAPEKIVEMNGVVIDVTDFERDQAVKLLEENS